MSANRKFVNLATTFVCFALVNASAQVSTTKKSNGAVVSATTAKASTLIPDAHPASEEALPAGATVIYSNFGTGTSLYDSSTGWSELGYDPFSEATAQAMSFTPDSNYILLRIDGAFTYSAGTNGMELILAEDNAGVPGKPIFITSLTNLPEFGTCCTVQTVKLTPTKTSYVELSAGATYWLYPLPADATGNLVWNWDTTNLSGTGALSTDSGRSWIPLLYSPFGAFDVYGYKLAN